MSSSWPCRVRAARAPAGKVIMDAIATRPYLLGHSETEVRRLAMQSAFWGELTGEIFRRAGIGAGMHVLDIGCGAGDVAFLAARLVGPWGGVLGIDRSEDAVRRASARAADMGLGWCRFAVADVDAFATDERFDAVVGRLVLMYLSDPARTLRSLVRHLRPGGIVAFHEIVLSSMRCVPPVALMRRVEQWVITAFERAGARVPCRGPSRRRCRFGGLRRARSRNPVVASVD